MSTMTTNWDALAAGLPGAYKQRYQGNPGWRIPCPAHGGTDANAAIAYDEITGELVSAVCHSQGCSLQEIKAGLLNGTAAGAESIPPAPAAGMPLSQPQWRVMRTFQHPLSGPVDALRYDHKASSGTACGVTTGGKVCGRADDHKECRSGKDGVPQGRLPQKGLLVDVSGPGTDPVILVEGEKAADAVIDAGSTVACWFGGAQRVKDADWTPLRGRTVILWPDDDNPGRDAMKVAATLVQEAGGIIGGVVDTDGDTHADAADCANASEVQAAIAGAVSWSNSKLAAKPATKTQPSTTAYEAGVWYARKYLDWWLYDRQTALWHAYDGVIWRDPPEPETAMRDDIAGRREQLAIEAVADGLDGKWFEGNAARSRKGLPPDFLSALRNECAGELASPPKWLLNTPDGEIDLRNYPPVLMPHKPASGHRSVTRGRYRPDKEEKEALASILRARLEPVFDHATVFQFLELAALTVSGNAQRHRGIVMLTGVSGSGKGGVLRLLSHALGSYAVTVDASWLDHRRGDIDATGADILYRQPRVIIVDELGGDAKVARSRVNTLSGDNELQARRPYQKVPYTGTIDAAMWTTSVTPPRLEVGDGIRRRLAVLPTKSEELPAETRQKDELTQVLDDALVTLTVEMAPASYMADYKPSMGDVEARETVLADMDELQSWLQELDAAWDGRLVSEVVSLAQSEVGEWVNANNLGRRIKQSPRWFSKRPSGGKTTIFLRRTEELTAATEEEE